MKLSCSLCKASINNYDPSLNHLEIDKSTSAEICQNCVDKFMKWQQGIYARLFPTTAVKRRFNRQT